MGWNGYPDARTAALVPRRTGCRNDPRIALGWSDPGRIRYAPVNWWNDSNTNSIAGNWFEYKGIKGGERGIRAGDGHDNPS